MSIIYNPSASYHRWPFMSAIDRRSEIVLFDYLDDLYMGNLSCSRLPTIIYVQGSYDDYTNYLNFRDRLDRDSRVCSFSRSNLNVSVYLCLDPRYVTQLLLQVPSGIHVSTYDSASGVYSRLRLLINNGHDIVDPDSVLDYLEFNKSFMRVERSEIRVPDRFDRVLNFLCIVGLTLLSIWGVVLLSYLLLSRVYG